MRFSFRRAGAARWIDTPDFAWVPDEPFALIPDNDTGPGAVIIIPPPASDEPENAAPAEAPEPAQTSQAEMPDLGDLEIFPAALELPFVPPEEAATTSADEPAAPEPLQPQKKKPAPPQVEPDPGPAAHPAESDGVLGGFSPAAESFFTIPSRQQKAERPEEHRADAANGERQEQPTTVSPPWHAPRRLVLPSRLLWCRLAIGLAQGLGLCFLTLGRDAGNPVGALLPALSLVVSLAPLVLLEGLGDMALAPLLCWTAAIGAALFGLGLAHQSPNPGDSGWTLLLLAGLVVFIAQALMRHWMRRSGRGYRALFLSTWSLAARVTAWVVATGAIWAFLATLTMLAGWPRFAGLHIAFAPTLLITPLMGLGGALAMHRTAGHASLMRRTRGLLLAVATAMLPLMVGVGLVFLAADVLRWRVPAAMLLAGALFLVIGINASYRGQGARGRARRWLEFAAALLVAVLTALAAVALAARIGQHGWTAPRVYAAAATLVLAGYGVLYGGAAFASIAGGRWMERIEPANSIMAAVVIAAAAALITLADPARVAPEGHAAQRGGDTAVSLPMAPSPR